MSCDAKFPADLSLSCVFGLIAEARNGITPATAKKALWVAGCLLEKIAPATVPPQAEMQTLEEVTLDDLLDALEVECQALETAQNSAGTLATPVAGTQGWEVILPMILQLVMFIIEQRQKKKKEEQQPAPAPAPAPAKSIGNSGSGTVPAPKKS
jgi:hypothetical protein